VDRGGYSLFDRRGDRPWRDGDPTKGCTVLEGASRAGRCHEQLDVLNALTDLLGVSIR
jgi:hypothetical protein